METRVYNGVTYQRSGPGEPWQRVGGGRMIPKSDTTQRKEGADASSAEADARLKEAQAQYAAQLAAAQAQAAQAQAAAAGASATKTGRENALPNLAPGQSKLDEEYSKRYAEWQLGGSQDARRNLEQLRGIQQRLASENLTGPVVGRLPEILAPQDVTDARERVEEVVQRNLRTILGAQFTEKEGERLIARAYNPRLDEKINAERLGRLIDQMEAASDANDAAASYFEQNGTLQGFQGDLWRGGNFDPEQAEVAPQGLRLPKAAGAHNAPPMQPEGATGKGGLQPIPELRGIENQVIDMIGRGATTGQVVDFLNEQYRPYSAEVGTELMGYIGDVVKKHRANPSKPVRSLGAGWENLSQRRVPDEESTLLGRIAETAPGNFVMNAANSATAGLPAYLAGKNDVLDAANSDHGLASFGGQLVGNLAGMKGLTGLAGMAGRAGRPLTAANGLGADAAFGATQGYLEGDGDWRYGLLGAGSAVAGNRVGAAAFGGDRVARPVEMALDTAPGQRIAQMLGTEVPPRPSAAQRIVARDVGENADAIAAMLAEGQSLGVPVTLADATPQLRARAGSAFRNAGQEARDEITQFMQGRQLGQADRALDQIEQSFGPVSNPNRVGEALTQQARAQAAPLYEAAYAAPGRMTPELEAILNTPAGQQALRNAQQIAANERRDPLALGFNDIDVEGNVALTRTPSMETLDLVKRGLDQVIEGRRDAVTGRLPTSDPSFQAVNGVRADLVRELDALNPDYAAARAAYAGPAQAREAMETGRGFMRLAPRDIEDQIGRMGSNEQDMYRLGARTALADRVEQARLSTNPLHAIYGSPVAQQRLAAIFPEGADRFGRTYALENEMARTGTELLGGSPTASRLAADEQLGNEIGEHVVNGVVDTALTGAPVRGGISLLGGLAARAGMGRMKEDVATEIAQMLAAEVDPRIVPDLLEQAAARRRYINDLRNVGGSTGSAAAIAAALAGGSGE